MSTKNNTNVLKRGIDRAQHSEFFSKLFSNRIAMGGLLMVVIMIFVALYARIFIDLDFVKEVQFGSNPSLAPPSTAHPFGTDKQARDIFKRVLYGTWLALLYGSIVVILSTIIGVALGVVAAYSDTVLDDVIMRTMDVLLAFPSLLLALAFVAILPQELDLWRAVIAITLVYMPRFARVVRGAALSIIEEEYIDASISLGTSDIRLITKHVIPNCLAPIIVQSTVNFGVAVIELASLSFLGFGASAGTPSLGLMLSNGVESGLLTGQWWWSFFPGLFLAFLVLGFNLFGDGMRDALDPRMRDALE